MLLRYEKYTIKSIVPLRGYGKYTRIYGVFIIEKKEEQGNFPRSSC